MTLDKVSVQNFMSIQEMELDLKNRGMVLIQGSNLDNPDLDNNGAGKSSIVESIVYALFGRTLRGLKGDSVIHNAIGKNCYVFLDLTDDDGTQYRIARYRKHHLNKNRAMLFRNGVNITPKSESALNDTIKDIIQSDYLTFISSVLYSPDSFRFASATDSEMKSMFDTMLGLDTLNECLAVTKEHIYDSTHDLYLLDSRSKSIASSLADNENQFRELTTKQEAFQSSRESKNESLLVELEKLKNSISGVDASISEINDEKWKLLDQLDELKSGLADYESTIGDIRSIIESKEKEQHETDRSAVAIDKKLAVLRTEMSGIQVSIDSTLKEIEKLNDKIQETASSVGSPCPTCGSPMTKESLESTLKTYQSEISNMTTISSQYQLKLDQLKTSEKDLVHNISVLNRASEDLGIEIKALNEKIDNGVLNDMNRKIAALERSIQELNHKRELSSSRKDALKKDASRVLSELDALEKEESPYEELIASNRQKRNEILAEQSELVKKSDEVKANLERLEFWKVGFSNQGIKSFILDDVTPYLNQRANLYLQKLTSGHIEIQFSTQTVLKNGESRDKFSVSIINQDGGSEYIANSSGEKRRIDLCINLALQDLVASRSTKKINIAVFDEIFDTLDDTGIEKVLELLTELSKERDTLLVVSHNEHLQSYFSNTITVEKKDGFSRLKGDNVIRLNSFRARP